MKQIVLNVPDKDYEFVLQLVKRFNFKFKETSEEIPDSVKKLLDERKAKSKKEDFLTISQFKRKVKSKYGI